MEGSKEVAKENVRKLGVIALAGGILLGGLALLIGFFALVVWLVTVFYQGG